MKIKPQPQRALRSPCSYYSAVAQPSGEVLSAVSKGTKGNNTRTWVFLRLYSFPMVVLVVRGIIYHLGQVKIIYTTNLGGRSYVIYAQVSAGHPVISVIIVRIRISIISFPPVSHYAVDDDQRFSNLTPTPETPRYSSKGSSDI